jgi:hypothetical protein
MKPDDGPRGAIARYAYGWSDDKEAAKQELWNICKLLALIGLVILWLKW